MYLRNNLLSNKLFQKLRAKNNECVLRIIGIYLLADLHPRRKNAPECTFPMACLPASNHEMEEDARMHLSTGMKEDARMYLPIGMFAGKQLFI